MRMLSGTQDEDKDSKLSLDDYKSAVLKERLLIESFGPCLPSRQVWCECVCVYLHICVVPTGVLVHQKNGRPVASVFGIKY